MSGKRKTRSSGHKSAQTSPAETSQSRLTSAATIKEDAPPYTVAAVCDRRDSDERRSQSAATAKLKFIDLFCGIGGFRIAFERAGCECVLSSDWNKQAQITYEANFHERPHGDIFFSLSAWGEGRGEVGACRTTPFRRTTFSAPDFPANPSASLVSPRNSASGSAPALGCGTMRPRIVHQERVRRGRRTPHARRVCSPSCWTTSILIRHDKGCTFQIIWETLTEHLQYHVHHRVIDAQSVVPQHRERIFLVGFRERRHFEFPESPAERPKLETISTPKLSPVRGDIVVESNAK